QEMLARRNAASKEVGAAKGRKDEEAAARLMAEVAGLKDDIAAGENDDRRLGEEIDTLLAAIPNLPLDDVPNGADENDNVEL
ncbi:serine--tRNA ligase, partial [Acinetobacter baumannii]